MVGWCLEILFTAWHAFQKQDYKLKGNTSLWMFPIYGLAAFFAPISQRLNDKSILIRGGLYTLLIFVTEFTTGSILRKFHRCPWDYTGQPANVRGLINLCYTPLWFGAGLFFERMLNVIPGEN